MDNKLLKDLHVRISNMDSAFPWIKKVFFLLSFLFLWLYLSNYSSQLNNKEVFHYQAEIFADKAGYYVYLPATFIYGFHASDFPKEVDVKTGNGFLLDRVNDKVRTKYTCGVSLLASPFFLANHLYQKSIGQPATGFTKSYFKMANYASVFYLLTGLVFLFLYLKQFFKTRYVIAALLVLFFATNLFYYSMVDTFMSHVYTFSMFSIFLWAFQQYLLKSKIKHFILLSFLMGIIVLIRPINVAFLGLAILLHVNSLKILKERILMFFKPLNLVMLVSVVFLVFLPQLLYFKFISGHFFYYSYANEGFSNLWAPKLKEVLFSPLNGLLVYTPVYLLFVAGAIYQIVQKKINGVITLFVFLLMLGICASWWCWSWGCSLGMRPFVDVLPILAIPLVFIIELIMSQKSIVLRSSFIIVLIYLSYANVTFSKKYSHCFMGSEWEWQEYHTMMGESDIYPFNSKAYKECFLNNNATPVRIKTADNHFLCTGNDFQIVENIGNKFPSQTENFGLIKIDDERVALTSYDNSYISSNLNMNGAFVANCKRIGLWEKLSIHYLQDGAFLLKNSMGRFVVIDSLNNNQLIAKSSSIDSAAHFRFVFESK